jgi:hypothetical protein
MLTPLILATCFCVPAQTGSPDAHDIEARALEARAQIRSGDLVIRSSGWTLINGERQTTGTTLRIVFDGDRLRNDLSYRSDPHREVYARLGGQHVFYSDEKPPSGGTLMANVTDLGKVELTNDQLRLIDARVLGLVPDAPPNLFRYELNTLVNSSNTKSIDSAQDDVLDGVPCFKVSRTLLNGLRSHVWIDRDRPGAVLRVDTEFDRPDDGHYLFTVRSEYPESSSQGAWYPRSCRFVASRNGEPFAEEESRVEIKSLNSTIDQGLLTLAGMGIRPGTGINQMPPEVPGLLQWDGKTISPIRETPSGFDVRSSWPLSLAAVLTIAAATLVAMAFRRAPRRGSAG